MEKSQGSETILCPSVRNLSSVLIGYLIWISLQSINGEEFDLGTTIVSNLYLVGNDVLLVPAIVIMWSLTRTDIFLLHRILLCLFIIINMLGDVGWVYHQVLVPEDEFAQQEWVWNLMYTISYLVLITGLIWYNKISEMMNKNIQNTVEKQYPYLQSLWNKTENDLKNNDSHDENSIIQNFNDTNQINKTIMDTLKNAHKEIVFLISTKEVFLRIKNEIYDLIPVIGELNINTRILIPESDELQDFANELNKYPTINFQRLYRSIDNNSVLFIIDTSSLLDLEFKKDAHSSTGANEILLYTNNEEQVHLFSALFENYWMLPLIHESIPNR
jgi:sugar-specific transcriptional regulator TrmB